MRLRAINWKPDAAAEAMAATGHAIAMRGGVILRRARRWVIHWPRGRA